MTRFTNIVTNFKGTPLAGFISSIDARRYAQEQSRTYGSPLTVTDFAGGVTVHDAWGWHVEAVGHGAGPIAAWEREGGKGVALLF